MPATPLRQSRLALALAALALLAACGTINDATRRFGSSIAPYKVEVVQGNFVSREQVQALQRGMSRDQVRQVLGTPLVTSLFHGDRWDYVFTLKRQGVEPQQRRLTVFFKDEVMDRLEGGEGMPSEAEFVTTLENKRKAGKVPRLEATEEELRAFSSRQGGSTPGPGAAAPATTPAPATNYPPLEAPAR